MSEKKDEEDYYFSIDFIMELIHLMMFGYLFNKLLSIFI